MTNIWKRSLSMFLAFVMVFGMVPVNAFATEAEEIVEEVLVEEVFEEEIFEEEIVEEIFEEEVFEEEIFEEEPVEEIFEEEIVEEIVEEEVISFETSDDAAAAVVEQEVMPAADGEYILWLNVGDQDNEIARLLDGDGIKEAILTAVFGAGNYVADEHTVVYDGEDVTGAGHENDFMSGPTWFAMEKGAVLQSELTNNNLVAVFNINGTDYPISFRDNRLKIKVEFNTSEVIEGSAADVTTEELYEILAGKIVSVTADDPMTPDEVEADSVDAEYAVTFSDYAWSDAIEAPYYSTITMTVTFNADSLVYDDDTFVHRATFKLEDNRGRFDVIYDVDGEETQYTVVEGNVTPAYDPKDAEAVPAKDYYTFLGWDTDPDAMEPTGVASTVAGDVTYYGIWKANLDKNNNGTADQEEKYSIYFLDPFDENNERIAAESQWRKLGSKNKIAWGTPYSKVIKDLGLEVPTKPGTNLKFAGWAETLPKTVTAPEGWDSTAWKFTATWTDKPVVNFVSPATGLIDPDNVQKLEDDDQDNKYYATQPAANIWDGYYVKGWWTEANKDLGADYYFDFATTAIEDSITLYPDYFHDRNNNGKEDETADEPLTEYYWFVGDQQMQFTDRLAEEDPIVPDGQEEESFYTYKEAEGDNRVFSHWERSEETAGYVTTVKFVARFHDDFNNNEVKDSDEYVSVEINGTGTVLIDGEEVTSGSVLYDSKRTIVVEAIPVSANGISQSYVASISLGKLVYADDHSATVNLQHADITAAEGKLTVSFAATGIEAAEKIAAAEKYTAKDICDAVSGVAVEGLEVEYLAREAKVTVDVSRMVDIIKSKAASYASTFEDFFNMKYPGGTYTYTYKSGEVWAAVGTYEAGTLSAQDALDDYLNDMNSKPIEEIIDLENKDKLMEQAMALLEELDAVIEANGYHAFGEADETVNITSDRLSATGVAVSVEGKETEITCNVPDVMYGNIKAEDLLNGISVNSGAKATVKFDVDKINGYNCGSYKIAVYAPAFGGYKPATANYILKITPAPATLYFPKETIIVMPGEDYSNDATPVANTDQYVHLIAGVDITSTDITLGENAQVNNLGAKAWMKIPENMWEYASVAGIELKDGEYTLGEIKALLSTDGLDAVIPGSAKTRIDEALNKLSDMLGGDDAKVFVNFVRGDESVFPTEIGAYINMAVSIDKNLTEGAEATGMILIHPGVAIPNNELDIVAEGKTVSENVYTFQTDSIEKLTVLQDVDADIRYFGLTNNADLFYQGTPTEPGVYVVSAIYTFVNEEGDHTMWSDAAIVTIYEGTTTVNIDNDVVTENGKPQMPKIIKGHADAAITVITAEADLSGDTIKATVDFPEGVTEVLSKLKLTLPTDVTVTQAIEKLEALPAAIEAKLEGPVNKLTEMGVPADTYIDPVVDKVCGYIDTVVAKLNEMVDELGADIVVTFGDHNGYTKAGVYYYAAVVTDPDYVPTADMGYFIIETEKFDLKNTTVKPGESYMDKLVENDTNHDYVMVVSGNGNVNIRLDDTANTVREKLAEILKVEDLKDGHAYPVSSLEGQPTDKAEKLADVLMAKVEEYADTKIKGYSIPEKAKKLLLDKAEGIINTTKTKLVKELEDLIADHANLTVTLNGDMPTEKGSYKVRALSYAVAYDEANLIITDDSIGKMVGVLSLDNIVHIVVKVKDYTGLANVNLEEKMGLLVWTNNTDIDDNDATYENAEDINPGSVYVDGDGYHLMTDGIPAKKLGDNLKMRVYVDLGNGNYLYSKVIEYSAAKYAYNVMPKSSTSPKLVTVLKNMLNYGAAAQVYFNHRTDDLMNAKLDPNDQILTWDNSILNEVVPVDENDPKVADFARNKNVFTSRGAVLALEGAVNIQFRFGIPAAYKNADEIGVMYWTAETFAKAEKLTKDNAEDSFTLTYDKGLGKYVNEYKNIAAKDLGKTVYACAYLTVGDNTYYSGVIAYSVEQYIVNTIAKPDANASANLKYTLKWLANYGESANKYFY